MNSRGNTVELVDARNPSLRLSLWAEPFDGDGYGSFVVVIESPELSLRHQVLTMGGDGLPEFFQELASDWRGWEGLRSWRSLEDGLCVDAKHTGGAVDLLVVVRENYDVDAWELRVPIQVSPGEALSELVSAVVAMVQPGVSGD